MPDPTKPFAPQPATSPTPKSGGFEGLLSVEVVVDPHDLSVAHRRDLCKLKLRHRPAARAPTVLAGHADHPIPGVDDFFELDLPLLKRERAEPVVLEESLDLFVAAIGTESGDAARGDIPNDLRRPDAFADAGVDSPSVEDVERSADQLHVLLRHRPAQYLAGGDKRPRRPPLLCKREPFRERSRRRPWAMGSQDTGGEGGPDFLDGGAGTDTCNGGRSPTRLSAARRSRRSPSDIGNSGRKPRSRRAAGIGTGRTASPR